MEFIYRILNNSKFNTDISSRVHSLLKADIFFVYSTMEKNPAHKIENREEKYILVKTRRGVNRLCPNGTIWLSQRAPVKNTSMQPVDESRGFFPAIAAAFLYKYIYKFNYKRSVTQPKWAGPFVN